MSLFNLASSATRASFCSMSEAMSWFCSATFCSNSAGSGFGCVAGSATASTGPSGTTVGAFGERFQFASDSLRYTTWDSCMTLGSFGSTKRPMGYAFNVSPVRTFSTLCWSSSVPDIGATGGAAATLGFFFVDVQPAPSSRIRHAAMRSVLRMLVPPDFFVADVASRALRLIDGFGHVEVKLFPGGHPDVEAVADDHVLDLLRVEVQHVCRALQRGILAGRHRHGHVAVGRALVSQFLQPARHAGEEGGREEFYLL